jgi:hypothetical protein
LAVPDLLLYHLPMEELRQLHLLVRPDTILRWHRDFLNGSWRSATAAGHRLSKEATLSARMRPSARARARRSLALRRSVTFWL